MNADQLKSLQAPLKDAYRDRPQEAFVTLRAVAAAFGLEMRGGRVIVEGDLDFRGTLGVSKDCPVGFQAIRVTFEIDSDASPELLDKAVAVAERYCVVLQTVRSAPSITVSRGRPAAGPQ